MNAVPALAPMLLLDTATPVGEPAPAESAPTESAHCEIASVELAPVAAPKARKPRVLSAFGVWFLALIVGNLATLAVAVALGLVLGIVMTAQGANGAQIQSRILAICQRPLPALLLSLVPFQLGMALVVFLAARRSKAPLKQRLGLVPPTGRTFSRFKLAMLASFTLSTALGSAIIAALTVGSPKTNSPIAAVINNGSWWAITLVSIVLSVIPALVEEILFRGYLQRRFLQRWSPAVAIGVSSVLFALMHMDSWQHMIAVVPLALVNGLLAYRTNSVKPGMLVHAIHNMGAVGFGAAITVLSAHMSDAAAGLVVLGGISVLALIGLPAVVSLLRRPKPQTAVEIHAIELQAVVMATIETPAIEMQAAEPVAQSPSAANREPSLPDFTIDSRLMSPVMS
jgi:membrane protease YdiL (CAAX protease family)